MAVTRSKLEIVALLQPGVLSEGVSSIFDAYRNSVRYGATPTDILDLLEELPADLLLIDCQFGSQVPDLLEVLGKSPELASIPVLFLTTAGKRPSASWVKMTEKSAYLDRPFGPNCFAQRVEAFLQTVGRPDYQSLRENRLVDSGSIMRGIVSELVESIRTSPGRYLLLLQSAKQTGVVEYRDGYLTDAHIGELKLGEENIYEELNRMDEGYYELLHQPNDWILQ